VSNRKTQTNIYNLSMHQNNNALSYEEKKTKIEQD